MIPAHLRLAILDFPKELLHRDEAARMLGDMVRQKQVNFERTSKSLVITDKHDMIGTHYLIYDMSQIYQPRVVAAIRTTYEDRAKAVNVPLPVDTYTSALGPDAQARLAEFRKKNAPIVDCNAWFVEPEYSKANSGLNLSSVLYVAVTTHLRRLGYDHFVGSTNERYKASQWLTQVGFFPQGMIYDHPYFPSPHKLILMERFYSNWMKSAWNEFRTVMENRYELIADSVKLRPMDDVLSELNERHLRVA